MVMSEVLEPSGSEPLATPSGVGIGFKPRKFLVAGDVVRIAIDGIGEIENAVVTEPPETIYIG